ncbi:MAG: hypothetical protein ACLRVN_01855 [Butyricicoccus sp.]
MPPGNLNPRRTKPPQDQRRPASLSRRTRTQSRHHHPKSNLEAENAAWERQLSLQPSRNQTQSRIAGKFEDEFDEEESSPMRLKTGRLGRTGIDDEGRRDELPEEQSEEVNSSLLEEKSDRLQKLKENWKL